MKRRLTLILLAVLVCIVGVYQTGLYPASGQTPTPSSTTGPLGSISGRVYVDVNANNAFESPDVGLPALLIISDPANTSTQAADDGRYVFPDLPAGDYGVGIIFAVPACARTAPFRWTGEPANGGCGFNHYTTLSATVELAASENRTGVDLPQVPETLISGRVWLEAQPLPPAVPVVLTVGGHPCWDASTTLSTTPAGVGYTTYSAHLEPLADPQCRLGDLDLSIGGRSANKPLNWEPFWRGQVDGGIGAFTYFEVQIPGFLALSGQAVEAGTVNPENVSRYEGKLLPDGTEVRALVGSTLCGSVKTKALRSAPSQAQPSGEFGGNLFGLIVPPADIKPGCGTPGAQVTFCVGDFRARQPAAGPFSYFQSPEAKSVEWAAPALADVTLEPTTEPCLATEAPPQLPVSLPQTGGAPE
jgi:hypothetical protein